MIFIVYLTGIKCYWIRICIQKGEKNIVWDSCFLVEESLDCIIGFPYNNVAFVGGMLCFFVCLFMYQFAFDYWVFLLASGIEFGYAW